MKQCMWKFPHERHSWSLFEMGWLPTTFGANARWTCPGLPHEHEPEDDPFICPEMEQQR